MSCQITPPIKITLCDMSLYSLHKNIFVSCDTLNYLTNFSILFSCKRYFKKNLIILFSPENSLCSFTKWFCYLKAITMKTNRKICFSIFSVISNHCLVSKMFYHWTFFFLLIRFRSITFISFFLILLCRELGKRRIKNWLISIIIMANWYFPNKYLSVRWQCGLELERVMLLRKCQI